MDELINGTEGRVRLVVRFWGIRGSIPTPGPTTARYGGNTSCVEVRGDGGDLFIFDCGTGIRELGQALLADTTVPSRIHILIGHTHWDHIQGFPFFTPVFLPGVEIHLYAPIGFQHGIEAALAGQMQHAYFPVTLQDLSSRIHYTELEEGSFRIGTCLIETQYLNHTAPTIAYRLTEGSTSIAYVTDHEPFWTPAGPDFAHPGDQRHIEFIQDADLVIHDAQYSDEEYVTKIGWGHSPVGYVRDVALAAHVKRLALFHHDPTHDDAWVDACVRDMQTAIAARNSTMEVFAAAEGIVLEVHGEGAYAVTNKNSALLRRSIAGERVLLVSPHASDVTAIERMLVEDNLVLMPASDPDTALKQAKQFSPSLVIMDASLLETPPGHFGDRLRTVVGTPQLPIMVLTDTSDIVNTHPAANDAVSDYITRPFNPPMLRTRVRACLARTLA
ncbi:MAG TPA: response regulator, partial [Nitrospirales bacterium]|nr:response regulator [Nitrospirales bacterium]